MLLANLVESITAIFPFTHGAIFPSKETQSVSLCSVHVTESSFAESVQPFNCSSPQ